VLLIQCSFYLTDFCRFISMATVQAADSEIELLSWLSIGLTNYFNNKYHQDGG
jgi:hypothetical protein